MQTPLQNNMINADLNLHITRYLLISPIVLYFVALQTHVADQLASIAVPGRAADSGCVVPQFLTLVQASEPTSPQSFTNGTSIRLSSFSVNIISSTIVVVSMEH